MPELLGATNPVPGYDSTAANRNIPVSPDNPQIQNVTDPTKVVRADRRTEQEDSSQGGAVRYDSNFQTFLQRLRESTGLTTEFIKLFTTRQGTVVSSGMSEGIAQEMAKALEMLRMDEGELLSFLTGQFKAGSRFGGALFALLRGAYSRAADQGVRQDILQFLKSYLDYSSTGHIEGNLLRNLEGMANSMPASWAEQLHKLLAQLQNGVSAGDRQGNLALIRQQVFPYMSRYVETTHDLGRARELLSLMALDVARYENGSEGNLLQLFHRLSSYGTLKDQLGGINDEALLQLLKNSQFQASRANQFADHLAAAASRAMRGEGGAETQEIFRQLVSAMLINESVYMPVNHYLLPLEDNGKMLFSELWVDPDDEDKENRPGGKGRGAKFLFKIDVQSLGLFDVVLTSRDRDVDIRIACPERVAPFARQIEGTVTDILTRNGLTPTQVTVRRMDRPVALTEVFPKIFEGMNSINVKV